MARKPFAKSTSRSPTKKAARAVDQDNDGGDDGSRRA